MNPSTPAPLPPAADDPLAADVYGLAAAIKRPWLLDGLNALTAHHRAHCAPYANVLDALWPAGPAATVEDLPWLPVRLFKLEDLASVPQAEIVTTLVSSGTTGTAVSRIHLDAGTARAQTRALARIVGHFTGNRRRPMLIVDSRALLTDRTRYNARAAGILGFSNFGRDHCYLLDERLEPDWDVLDAWLARHPGEPVLVFGFTFLVWQALVEAARRAGRRWSLPAGSLLIHGGGWKRLADRAVDNDAFKAALAEAFNLTSVHNYYGMVEQVGAIHFECEHGRLHAPAYADVIIRDPRTLAPLPMGQPGLIQVLSLLPRSYPGHSLLTEDLGSLLGEDDCPCGRPGRTFAVHGRIRNVEMRGCSDTRAVPA
jgi:hypothetical protein